MKKLVTTLLLTALTAASIFAFTACGGNDDKEENKEPVYTVTAEEWKTAVNYLNSEIDDEEMPVVSDYQRINFACEYKINFEEDSIKETIKTAIDYDKNVMEVLLNYNGYGLKTIYAWKDNNKYYGIGLSGEGEYFKEVIDSETDFKLCLESNLCEYAGGRLINEFDLANKFSSFTYSEDKCEYNATIESPWGETADCEVTVKMKDGRLVSVLINSGSDSYTLTYTYGNTLTVPENFLNMEVSE